MSDTDPSLRSTWGMAALASVVGAMLLAGVGLLLAMLQVRSQALLRIADAEREAGWIAQLAESEARTSLQVVLGRALANLAGIGSLPGEPVAVRPDWVGDVFLVSPDADGRPRTVVWRRSHPTAQETLIQALGVEPLVTPEGLDTPPRQGVAAAADADALVLPSGQRIAMAEARAVQRAWHQVGRNRVAPIDLQIHTEAGGRRAFSWAWRAEVDGDGPVLLAAAVIDAEAFARQVVEPKLAGSGGRIRLSSGESAGQGDAARAPAWRRGLEPLAPRHWLVPDESFVVRQRTLGGRQTAVFAGAAFLGMLAMLAVMGALWRVLKREVALSRLKQSFVADVSHELKTPLALIHMFGETLLEDRVPSEAKRKEYYEIITRESTRLTSLIDNILDFARIEAGRKQYRMVRTDVARLVNETYETYREQLDRERFEHGLRSAAGLPEVCCDRDAVAQVLINLINNAVKYADEDKFLEIVLSAETRRGQHGVLISVSDRGIGIRPEERGHLFTGFYRADDHRVRRRRGAGLGLALVKHIVDSHGGIVDVESRLVKGTTFRVFLPENRQFDPVEEHGDVQNPDR